MKATRKRHSRRGWDKPEDELVAIVGERVVAALEAHGMSLTELAESIGDSQQTVSLICNGTTKRTRRSRVQRMADVFELPSPWLMGTAKELPGIAEGFTGAHLHATKGDANHPAAWQIAISKWETQTDLAYTRDHKDTRDTRLEHYLRERFALAFMIHPGVWRDLLFDSPDWRKLTDDEEAIDEDTQVQLVNFMLDVFQPWFDGKAKLNYRNLFYIFGDVANQAVATLKRNPAWRKRFAKNK